MAPGPSVSFRISEKRYGEGPKVLADFSLTIESGSVVALVGPSGVGKSTLLRIVSGIDRDFSGEVTIAGQPAWQAPPPGLVFQDSRLLPWLTTAGNLSAVRPQTTPAEALNWLGRVGLAESADAFPGQLSGGMQRRVALARALSVNPRFLLLDEPFISLDRSLIAELEALFATLIAEENSTAMLVTHMIEDAAALADRLVAVRGRPARIVADIPLEIPRAERDAVTVARLAAELTERLKEMQA